MDKIVRELSPNKTYKLRYVAVYNDETESAPSIAYTLTTPTSPNPPQVDQEAISVDSESFPSGIIISWQEPEEDPSLPLVEDYLVQITDNVSDWGKFQTSIKDTKIIFSQENQLTSFGQLVPTIFIRVITRGVNKNFDTPTGYREYSYELEQTLRPPDIVSATAGWYSYTVNWAYTPARPDIVAGYKIYYNLESTPDTTINNASTNTYTSNTDLSIGGQTIVIGVSAFDSEGNESAIKYSNRIKIEEVALDLDAPPQRENISFSSVTGTPNVLVSWTNTNDAGDEILNKDLAGVTVRYALVSDSENYTWIDIPFSFADNLENFEITGLVPNTEYEFSLSTYDILFNRTDYFPSDPQIVTTDKDNVPPPKPAPPTVSGGTGQEAMIVRVWQYGREPDGNTPDLGTGTPLPPDTSYFQVWMLENTYTTAPTGTSNPNATLLGDMPAGFGGLETQKIFFVSSVPAGQQRYFYVRAVDTSGNISVASNASQSTALVYFGDAHVDRLSANKLKAGSIQADTTITIGTGTNSIKINGGTGSIYSGVGSYNNSSTGFFLDDSGVFSLKDRLTFDGTTLSVKGDIEAQSGRFTGNVLLQNGGSLYSGDEPTYNSTTDEWEYPNNSIVVNRDGVVATGSSGKFFELISSTGSAFFSGSITGSQGIFTGSIDVSGITLNKNQTTEISPTLVIDSGSSGSSYLAMLRRVGSEIDSAIEFYVGNSSTTAFLRGRVSHDGDGDGGSFNITAYKSSSGITPGILKLDAEDGSIEGTGEIQLNAPRIVSSTIWDTSLGTGAKIVAVNSSGRLGYATASELSIDAGYVNATDTVTGTNSIKYGTENVGDVYTNPKNGDIYLKYT